MEDKDKIEILKQITDIKDDMGVEYFVLSLRLFKSIKPELIKQKLVSLPDVMTKLKEFKKYLID